MRDLLTALQQGFALFDAESVLFVDDRKGKIRRLECPRKRGVRGNDDARLAARRRRERFATCRKLHAAGDQRDRNVKSRLADHAADGFGVLLGKHLRGGDKHRLIARSDGLQHRDERDHGFAGADFALQQALHRVVAAHVLDDVVDDAGLPAGQGEGERIDEGFAHVAVSAGEGLGFARLLAFLQDGGLRDERFLISQGVKGLPERVHRIRFMYGKEGFGPMHQAACFTHALGQDVRNGATQGGSRDFGGCLYAVGGWREGRCAG